MRNVWRQIRKKIRDMVLHPRCSTIRISHAIRQFHLDDNLRFPFWISYCIGILLDCGLRHRSDARQGGIDCRYLLRTDVWIGWSRICLLWMVGRQNKHRIHFPGKCLPTIIGHYRRFSAKHPKEGRALGRNTRTTTHHMTTINKLSIGSLSVPEAIPNSSRTFFDWIPVEKGSFSSTSQ